ncbi:hypothetical protein BC827DRAFT_1271868 [Russula dissimulans]|nr:hypothetical protein BC827DRAFT_1271868 [Russula dissimulans]
MTTAIPVSSFAVENDNSFPVQLWYNGQKVGAPIGPGETSRPYSEPGEYQAHRSEEPTPEETLLEIRLSLVAPSADKTFVVTRDNGNFGVSLRFAEQDA